MTESVKSTLERVFTSYKRWIVANPQLLSDIETTIKCLSYFGVGNFSNSNLVLEMIYSIPNLIMLCNDMLMYHSTYVHPKIPEYESKIKIWLTALEYAQTLFEVSGKKLGGETGKWLIITVVQLSKAILRLLLIYLYNERVTKTPSVPPLNREKFNKATENLQLKEGFKLKRSGIVVRNIKHADPIGIRTWKALSNTDENQNLTKNQVFDRNLKLAEIYVETWISQDIIISMNYFISQNRNEMLIYCLITEALYQSLYAIKPLLYLGCVSVTGQQRWQPWTLSLFIDLVSLQIFQCCSRNTAFDKEEKLELARRKISLLLYILRSPFYERCSRTKINAMLDKISTSVPLTKLLTSSLKRQMSYIQSVHFYTW